MNDGTNPRVPRGFLSWRGLNRILIHTVVLQMLSQRAQGTYFKKKITQLGGGKVCNRIFMFGHLATPEQRAKT